MASIISAGTTSGTALNLSSDTSGVLQLASNSGTTALTITTAQNVGIGTASPAQILDVRASTVRVNFQSSNNGAYSTTRFLGNNSVGSAVNFEQGINIAADNAFELYDNTNTTLASRYISGSSGYWAWSTNSSERMRIDSSGNLLVGVTSASYSSANRGVINIGGSSGGLLSLISSTNKSYFLQSGADLLLENDTTTGNIIFGTNASTERMRIDSSGNLLVGTTTTGGNPTTGLGFNYNTGSSYFAMGHITGTASGTSYQVYNYNATAIGSITQSGTTAVLYNTTSDQRLKENIVDAPSGNINDIKVRSFDWKSDGSHQTYGMVAQELLEVAPYAVHQPQNPEEMMAVDYSKLVPMMIKEIQDLKQRIATLEK